MSTQPPTLGRLLGTWAVDPLLLAVCCLAAALYVWGVVHARTRWPVWRTASFLAGLLALLVALTTGIGRYADELLSIHVVEHLLLILTAPSLILWGAPVRLALIASPPAGRQAIARLLRGGLVRLLTRPACGFALFTLVVLGTHLTGVCEAALRNQTIHAFEHAAYFWSGMLFLAPLLAADPIPHPPGAIARFSWLMAAMLVMSVPAGVFLFDPRVRYPFYLAPARVLHTTALADQRAAGMLMLVAGGLAMGAMAIVIAMQAMIAEERRQRRRDTYLPHDAQASREVVGI
ncbi:MAG TPA: cytochrome c oxidase assembly protein [Solirubrobacteraceae bacterium]|nr:cytochrome c oxidase assembly protein [Solirubrobacteraceae bacterium]